MKIVEEYMIYAEYVKRDRRQVWYFDEEMYTEL